MSEGSSGQGGGRKSDAERAAEVAGGAQKAIEGIGKALGEALGGKDDPTAADVQRAFSTAGQVAGAVSAAAQAAHGADTANEAVRRGDAVGVATGLLGNVGGVAGTLGGVGGAVAEATGSEEFADVARAMRTVQTVANTASTLVRDVAKVLGASSPSAQQSRHVEYRLEVEGCEDGLEVRSFVLEEELNGTYEAVVRVRCDNRDIDVVHALVGRDASVLVDRREGHSRRVCGIVHRVVELGARERYAELELSIVPAFALLGHGCDSRIFQDKTAVQIVEETLRAEFAPYRRELDTSGLTRTYATREMCVQYRESYQDFVSRLLEEEGIGYYFDFDGDGPERMVLFDANSQLAPLATMDGNAVPFAQRGTIVEEREPVVSFQAAHRLGATSITVRDLDWTEPQYRAEATRDERDERGFARAVYDHGHGRSVTLYEFRPGGRYGANDADFQARIRSELLMRDRHRYAGVSMVVGMRPGVTFELNGHPVPGVDGRYLVVKVRHESRPPPAAAEEGARGEEYHNTFECIPADTAFVPDRRTPKPVIAGVQTAVVSGPRPGEPYTDEYGRVKVQFHWNREAVDPARTSAWVRLAQTWAGHDSSGLHTFLFIPRVGSEVIVTFLDGDPDRPLVTGAVYNAQNLPPLSLPDEATRSVIRTESIGGGGGHNELSFEDASGREEIFLRAQRNLRELVLNDHLTHVKRNHANTVDGDDTETVGGQQELTVRQSRWKTVQQNETNTIRGERVTFVGEEGGRDYLHCYNNREVRIDGFRDVDVANGDVLHVGGERVVTIDHGLNMTVANGVTQTIVSGGWTLTTTGDVAHTVTGSSSVRASNGVSIHAGGSLQLVGSRDVNVMGGGIRVNSLSEISAVAQGSVSVVSPGPITLTSPTAVNINGPKSIFEATIAKIAIGMLSIGVTDFKLEMIGLKFADHAVEFKKGKFEAGYLVSKVAQWAVGIMRGSTMIG